MESTKRTSDKEIVEKDDGRYLILYTFGESDERSEQTSTKVAESQKGEERSDA